MVHHRNSMLGLAVVGALCALLLPAPVRGDGLAAVEAKDAPTIGDEGPEIERRAVELQQRLRDRRVDLDSVDTALVFNNTRWPWAIVKCAGYDDDGRFVGAARTRVPPNGLRFLLASDIAHGRDFVGSVICRASGRLLGSSLLIGAELTDLRVVQRGRQTWTVFRFPLVASY